MAWNYRLYGSLADPIHKSHLNTITGDFGCLRKFRYQRDEHADAEPDAEPRGTVNAKTACGTAVHEVMARALAVWNEQAEFTREHIQRAFAQEFTREVGARLVDWRGEDPAKMIAERVTMIHATLTHLRQHVASVELVEAGFIVQLGDYWLSGHVDLVYRPRDNPDGLGLADWKTGATRPDPLDLDHSWEAGVYAAALRHGFFVRRESLELTQLADMTWAARASGPDFTIIVQHASRYIAERQALELMLMKMAASPSCGREMAFNQYPTEIRYVHMGDYVPYVKSGHKRVERVEDLRHWGLTEPGQVKYQATQTRGPAWLHVRQTEQDIPRLLARLQTIVGTVRLGRFIDMVSASRCKGCPYSQPCLNSGYGAVGDEHKQLETMIKQLGLNTGNP